MSALVHGRPAIARVASVIAILVPSTPAPVAPQELPSPRFSVMHAPGPALDHPVPVSIRGVYGSPGDAPPPLPPAPPHHTRNVILVTGGASVAAFGILLALPSDITGWSARDRSWNGIQDEWEDFKRHVTHPPVWDRDSWFFNYLGHPWVGMHTYLMERNYGSSPLRGFLFSTAASVFFEYGIEAWAEPPSAQDLLVTSPVGSVLGELNFRWTQEMRRGGLTFWEKALVTVVNPLHVIQHGYQ
jgi:hypothetical protein